MYIDLRYILTDIPTVCTCQPELHTIASGLGTPAICTYTKYIGIVLNIYTLCGCDKFTVKNPSVLYISCLVDLYRVSTLSSTHVVLSPNAFVYLQLRNVSCN